MSIDAGTLKGLATWDESKHPRDAAGKFSSTGGESALTVGRVKQLGEATRDIISGGGGAHGAGQGKAGEDENRVRTVHARWGNPRRGRMFQRALRAAAESHKNGAAVEVKDLDAYTDRHTRLITSADGKAGVAVMKDGTLVSVFKHKESTAKIHDLLAVASRSATKLDCFDNNGKLPDLYAQHGFVPVARVDFNEQYAPPKWNYERDNHPNVLLMVKDTAGHTSAPKIKDRDHYFEIRESIPRFSKDEYDKAEKVMNDAVAKVKTMRRT